MGCEDSQSALGRSGQKPICAQPVVSEGYVTGRVLPRSGCFVRVQHFYGVVLGRPHHAAPCTRPWAREPGPRTAHCVASSDPLHHGAAAARPFVEAGVRVPSGFQRLDQSPAPNLACHALPISALGAKQSPRSLRNRWTVEAHGTVRLGQIPSTGAAQRPCATVAQSDMFAQGREAQPPKAPRYIRGPWTATPIGHEEPAERRQLRTLHAQGLCRPGAILVPALAVSARDGEAPHGGRRRQRCGSDASGRRFGSEGANGADIGRRGREAV